MSEQAAFTMDLPEDKQRPESLTCPNCSNVMRWRKGKRVCRKCGCELD